MRIATSRVTPASRAQHRVIRRGNGLRAVSATMAPRPVQASANHGAVAGAGPTPEPTETSSNVVEDRRSARPRRGSSPISMLTPRCRSRSRRRDVHVPPDQVHRSTVPPYHRTTVPPYHRSGHHHPQMSRHVPILQRGRNLNDLSVDRNAARTSLDAT